MIAEEEAVVHFHKTRSGLESASPAEKALAERYGRQVALELLGRNRPAAIHVVDQALQALDPPKKSEFYSRPLADILDVKLANALERNLNLLTVEDVLGVEQSLLLTIPNFGMTSLAQLAWALLKAALERLDSQN